MAGRNRGVGVRRMKWIHPGDEWGAVLATSASFTGTRQAGGHQLRADEIATFGHGGQGGAHLGNEHSAFSFDQKHWRYGVLGARRSVPQHRVFHGLFE